MNELQQLLVSGLPLWITADGYKQAMLSTFPLHGAYKSTANPKAATIVLTPKQQEFLATHSFYQLETRIALESLLAVIAQSDDDVVSLTDDFSDESLPENSIAYHRVWGVVLAQSNWYFSSKQLEEDLKQAENNPQITCHFLHINTPGGEAWYMDRLSETLRNCNKPIITLCEQLCCSAGYYIGCHGQRVYGLTQNDMIGCIGTMCSFYDFEAYYKKLGITKVEAKATNSDLKNKMFDDLRKGKSEQYVREVLNPLCAQFLTEVREQRKALASLADDAPVLRGETFLSSEAEKVGLIDGCKTMTEVLVEAVTMGKEYAEKEKLKSAIYNIV